MIEDTELTEFRLKSIDPGKVVSSEKGEVAYSVEFVKHGTYSMPKQDVEHLAKITSSSNTFAFESDTECDFCPFVLATYNTDKSLNAEYRFGDHAPGENNYKTPIQFKPGDKVLCFMYEGYDAVFPGIIIGHFTEEALREFYESNEEWREGWSSVEEALEKFSDFSWDSVLIRPLVRLKTSWSEMGNVEVVNRVYVFPYKQFDV